MDPAPDGFILCFSVAAALAAATERRPGCGRSLQLHLSCQVLEPRPDSSGSADAFRPRDHMRPHETTCLEKSRQVPQSTV
ncbi:uncharacterized protein V6R79_018998 [Siganus canaliculatus]